MTSETKPEQANAKRGWGIISNPTQVAEAIAQRLAGSPWVKLVEYAGKFAVLVSVALFIWTHDAAQRTRHAQAWDIILSNEWKDQPSGRAEALATLVWGGVPLASVRLGPVKFQPGLDLSGCYTVFGWRVPLPCHVAEFDDAYLEWASLPAVNLRGARLRSAHMKGAYMITDVNRVPADLRETDLSGAELNEAFLLDALLRGATLNGATFWATRIYGVDFVDAKGLTAEQLDNACLDEARPPTLPAYLSTYDVKRPNKDYCRVGMAAK